MVLILLAGGMALAFDVGIPSAHAPSSALPATPIELPDPDVDGDTYGDDVDLWEGDALVVMDLTGLDTGDDRSRPYIVVGTQDDHWRLGEGREREWRRVVDHDPFGHRPGSPGWHDRALVTGHWLRTEGHPDHAPALGEGDVFDGADDAVWPQRLIINVRDDQDRVGLVVQVWDERPDPDRRLGAWEVNVGPTTWATGGNPHALGAQATLNDGSLELTMGMDRTQALDPEVQRQIADRWSPVLRFDSEERLFPARGDGLERFHGFFNRTPDLQTWERSFNNGVDAYRLMTGDVDGDGRAGASDAAAVAEILREGGPMAPTIYAAVDHTTGGRIVVQYWFLYAYNFVLDEVGREVPALAHDGDREFIQLTFRDLAATAGSPEAIAYSQHYGGIRVPDPDPSGPLFVDGHPQVFVARGSHASFPTAGVDRTNIPVLSSSFDRFDGLGPTWTPDDYALEILGNQTWHAGYQWGPTFRYARDRGVSFQVGLVHSFSYPFLDPMTWQESLTTVEEDALEGRYPGGDA